MSELLKRILFAVPAAALFLAVTWVGGWYFYGLIILIALLAQREMNLVCGKAGFKPDDFFPYTIALWILLSPKLPHFFEFGLVIFLLFVAIQVFKRSDHNMQEFVSTMFCGSYVSLGLLMMIIIRNTGTSETGFVLTLSLLLMVWGNDVFAYFGGKYLGSHLMAPKISPKKTWEGFLFGMAGAVFGLLVTFYFIPIPYPIVLLYALPVTVMISIFGPLGDLAVSKLKRAADLKDTANILPGHGGFLDRFDALILAGPTFYVYLHFLTAWGYVTL